MNESLEDYVVFFSASGFLDGEPSSGYAAYVGEKYADGTFVYNDNGSNLSSLSTTPWTNWPGDLAFTISFNVPEPATLLLLGLGGLVLRKRRR